MDSSGTSGRGGIDGLAVASAVIAQPDIKKSAADLKALFFGKEAVNEL